MACAPSLVRANPLSLKNIILRCQFCASHLHTCCACLRAIGKKKTVDESVMVASVSLCVCGACGRTWLRGRDVNAWSVRPLERRPIKVRRLPRAKPALGLAGSNGRQKRQAVCKQTRTGSREPCQAEMWTQNIRANTRIFRFMSCKKSSRITNYNTT